MASVLCSIQEGYQSSGELIGVLYVDGHQYLTGWALWTGEVEVSGFGILMPKVVISGQKHLLNVIPICHQ